MHADNDLAIVQAIQAGNKDSFALLVAKYDVKIQRLIFRFVKNESITQELTQDSFIKAYRALHNFRGDSAFYTWLYRIAVNVAKTWLIQNNNVEFSSNYTNQEDETFDLQDTLIDNNTPDDALHNQQLMSLIQRTVDNLPHDLRTALTLREIDGLSYEEIAVVMDCPIGTVRSRIFRARDILTQKLSVLVD
jgi:RNA polymerase sigma-70 factor (ECF subfamily)